MIESSAAADLSFNGHPLFRLRRAALGLTAFLLPISIAASNVAAGLAAASCLAVLAAFPSRRMYRWTGMEVPWAACLLVWTAAAALSPSPSHSLSKMSANVTILFFLLASQGQDADDAARNLKLFLAACGIAGALGVVQYFSGADWNPALAEVARPAWMTDFSTETAKLLATRNGRSLGFFSHPLTYAEILLMGFALGLGRVFYRRGNAGPIRLAALGAALAGLLCSGSRGVWLAVLFLLGLWSVVRRKKRVMVALGLLVLAGVLLAAFHPKLRHRVETLRHLGTDPSSSIRFGIWRSAARTFADRPVLGVGQGNVRLVSGAGPEPGKAWTEAHNIYLQAAVEAGMPGLAVFLWFLWSAARVFWRAPPGWNDGLFFAFAGLLFAGLTESWTRDAEVVMALNFLLGSAAAMGRGEENA